MAEIPTTKALRAVTIATLIPAFPLCIVHGALSNRPVPAVGLVPLFFSAGTSLFLLARHAKHQREQTASGRPAGADGGEDGESEPEREQEREQEQERDRDRDREHEGASAPPDDDAKGWPILVFFWDLVLAAALMTVLTFTWLCTRYEGDASLSMLAAYATLPLLVNL